MPQTPTAHNISPTYFVSREHLINWGCDLCLATIPVIEWDNVDKLIDLKFKEKALEKGGKACLNNFIQSFKKVSEKSEYAALRFFCKYMEKTFSTEKFKNNFLKMFKFRLEQEKLEQEKKLNDIKIARMVQAGLKRKIDDFLASEQSSTNTVVTGTAIACRNKQSVSEILKSDADVLHIRYKKGEKMSSDELKRMSLGLSSIIDLIDCSPEGQRSIIGEETWAKLCSKYLYKYQVHSHTLKPKIEETLVIVEKMCKSNKNDEARSYLNSIINNKSIVHDDVKLKKSLRAIDFALEVFEEQTYLFDPEVAKTLSEKDYVTGAWLPLLKKCLYINDNNVRALVGETSNSYTTNKKSEVYGPKSVGFKIDIRFVTSINGKLFDVGAAEAAKIDPLTDKIIDDEGKLLREGKDIVDNSVQTILLEKETSCITGWMLQLSGLNGYIYSIHLTEPGLYVAIPQSPIQFPSKFTPSATFTKTFSFLLTMCQSMNNLALEAQNAVTFSSLNQDSISNSLHIRRSRNDPSNLLSWIRPSYYTPPNHDCAQSNLFNNYSKNFLDTFTEYIKYGSDDDDKNASADPTGWIRLESGMYYNIYSNTYSECNPL